MDDPALAAIAQQMAGQSGGLENWAYIRRIMSGALNLGVSPGQLTDSQLRDLFGGTAPGASTINLATRGLSAYQLQLAGVPFGAYTGGGADWSHMPWNRMQGPIGYSTPLGAPRMPQWYDDLPANMVNFGLPQQSAGQRYAGQRNYADWIMGMIDQYGSFAGTTLRNGRTSTDSVFFSEEDVQRAHAATSALTDLVSQAERWSEITDNGMITEDDLERMRGMVTEAQAWEEHVRGGSAALASISELFGQQSGGQFDALNQDVLRLLEAGGATAEQLQSAEQTMGLRSGTITGMSAQWDNTISQDLADIWLQLGPEAYFQAQQDYLEYVRNIRTQNPDFSGTVPWDLILRDAGINQNQGSAYTVQPGDTVWGLARAQGMTVQEYMAANGLDNTNLQIGQQIGSATMFSWDESMISNAGDVQAATDARAQQMADSYQYNLETAFETSVDTLQSALEGVVVPVVQVPFELVFQGGGGGVLGQLIAAAVQANGGVTPGTSANTGRSGAGQRGDGTYSRGR